MAKQSAGVLLYRHNPSLQVLLIHPGGPYWARKDLGAWAIPKGGVENGQDPKLEALRELEEEIGLRLKPEDLNFELGAVKMKSGKVVTAWAARSDFHPKHLKSIAAEIEWPPRSGKMKEFPEVDKAEWYGLKKARKKIHPAQAPLLDRLEERLGRSQL